MRPESQFAWKLAWLAAVGLALAIGLPGCYSGAYRVDLFPEMHYQASWRRQEPPRLYPATDAVPTSGREVSVDFVDVDQLANPLQAGPVVQERGAALYKINCLPCHGQAGKGDGIVAAHFKAANVPLPADLTSPAVQGRSVQRLFWIVTNGRDNMPPFRTLLTEEERWALAMHLKALPR